MKDDLAEALLGSVMGWQGAEAADDVELILALARYKYDEYQRFEPGRKFVESLALWLEQFDEGEERRVAFDFVKRRLIFVSHAEMTHLVTSLYPDVICPIIRQHAATELHLPTYRIAEIESSEAFQRLHRQCVFLALSDGARMDTFRRSNPALSNEQVHATYEVELGRRTSMHEDLVKALRTIGGTGDETFRLVFLLDDFAGSGTTLLRWEDEAGKIAPPAEGKPKGRLERFAKLMNEDASSERSVFSGPDTAIYVCLYLATRKALDYLDTHIPHLQDAPWKRAPSVSAVQAIGDESKVTPDSDPRFVALLEKYYDERLQDEHKNKGGDSVMFGYAGCSLPLVLHHNSPNNSVYLLWAETDRPLVPLFSRMERHR